MILKFIKKKFFLFHVFYHKAYFDLKFVLKSNFKSNFCVENFKVFKKKLKPWLTSLLYVMQSQSFVSEKSELF